MPHINRSPRRRIFGLGTCVSLVPVVAAIAVLAGCSATNSSELDTSDIKAYLRVEVSDDSPNTRFSAIFSEDISTDVRLENGDQILVTTDKDAHLQLQLGSLSVYSAEVPQNDRTTATFALARPSKTAAPNSTVVIPPTIALTAPLAMANVPYAGGAGTLTLTWSNKSDGASVIVYTSPCDGTATTGGKQIPDTGSYDLSTADMTVGAPTAAECIELRIVRATIGTTDPAYKSGSSLQASRTQSIKVQLTP